MSMQTEVDSRLEFDRADRIRRAMRVSGVGVQELAADLQVSRNTITNWISGRTAPRPRDMRALALRTGFPLSWLETGTAPSDGDGADPSRLRESNPRPIHYE